MFAVTIEAVQAKQAELAAMIQLLQQQAAPAFRSITLPATEIELQAGEHYAGAVLDQDGTVLHHVVLMAPRPTERLSWKSAVAWAAAAGGDLPSRQEQALLFANCMPHIEKDWYWSGEAHTEDDSYAWYCIFGDGGGQDYGHQFSKGAAVAVRRLNP